MEEASHELKKEAEKGLQKLRKDHGCEGVTADMKKRCEEWALPMIAGFAKENHNDGCVQLTAVVEKQVQDGNGWVKECQVSVEVDADFANERLGQTGHMGCEIYFANKEACVGKGFNATTAGQRVLKKHAYLPEGINPPYYRPGIGVTRYDKVKLLETFLHNYNSRASTILYRCKIVATRVSPW